jgi:Ras GTPase-activating-like protein IQGAP2/3
MEPSNSTSSSASTSSKGPFAYQTRLLERTSSRGASSLSRSNSQSSINNLINSTGSTVAPATARRWVPTHRVGSSLDVVRGKFEELARESGGDDTLISPPSPVKDTYRNRAPSTPSAPSALVPSKPLDREPSTPLRSPVDVERQRTPIYLKRRTLPAPIIASPLSPNVTGIPVEVDSPLSSMPHRIHLPDAIFNRSSSKHGLTNPSLSGYSRFQQTDVAEPHTSFLTSSPPVDAQPDSKFSTILQHGDELPLPSSPRSSSPLIRRRPESVHGAYPYSFPAKDTEPPPSSTSSIVRSTHSKSGAKAPVIQQPGIELSKPTSVMSPVPYRSAYMSNKKSGEYSSTLGIGHHRLGRHLPRIASGDGDDLWEEKDQPSTLTRNEEPARSDRQTREGQMQADGNGETSAQKSSKPERSSPSAPIADAVMGLPNRIPLKAPTISPSPLPSARGLWADKQRHLIQAYEYLCHVGEAQQWIEGCLGEELEFGVVEMEEGLRNGIVLAKLVRVFRGDAAVRKIYEVCISAR